MMALQDGSAETAAFGALRRWREALRKGEHGQIEAKPSTWKLNALWKAACYEAEARECESRGLFGAAKDSYQRARRILGENRTERKGRLAGETKLDAVRPLSRARMTGKLQPLSAGYPCCNR